MCHQVRKTKQQPKPVTRKSHVLLRSPLQPVNPASASLPLACSRPVPLLLLRSNPRHTHGWGEPQLRKDCLHGLRLERRGMRCLLSGTPLPCLRFCTSGCSERPHKTTARSNRGFIAVLASPAVTLRRLPKQVLLRVCRIGRTENLPAVLHVLVPRVWWPCIKDLLPLTQHWPRPLRREAAANLTCPKPSGILGLAQRGCPPKSERQRKPRLVHHEPLSVQLEPPGVHPQ